MASFLDNTGDIILDAVLTDYGRQLLAKGDGSFNIVKFAFGDDEIDYGKWDTSAVTTLKDQYIVKTPILEAFTNNAASLKNKLLTLGIENLLYLPIVKLNTSLAQTGSWNSKFTGFVVSIDNEFNPTTVNALTGASYSQGVLNVAGHYIAIDQGIDSTDLSKNKSLANEMPELFEKEYNIIIDNRLGYIIAPGSSTPEQPVSIDDDNMATYKASLTVNSSLVEQISTESSAASNNIINGFQGTRLKFSIKPTNTVNNSSVLDRLGEELELVTSQPNYKSVRTSVEIVGITTGYSLEIPVLFAKKV